MTEMRLQPGRRREYYTVNRIARISGGGYARCTTGQEAIPGAHSAMMESYSSHYGIATAHPTIQLQTIHRGQTRTTPTTRDRQWKSRCSRLR